MTRSGIFLSLSLFRRFLNWIRNIRYLHPPQVASLHLMVPPSFFKVLYIQYIYILYTLHSIYQSFILPLLVLIILYMISCCVSCRWHTCPIYTTIIRHSQVSFCLSRGGFSIDTREVGLTILKSQSDVYIHNNAPMHSLYTKKRFSFNI